MSNLQFERRYLGGRRKDFPITEELRDLIDQRLSGIHNWIRFIESQEGIEYCDLVNLRHGNIKYLSPASIKICNVLDIDLNEVYTS